MPKGPKGEKRPADVIGNAVHVMRVATGEISEEGLRQPKKRRSGQAGAKARAAALSPNERKRIGTLAAEARWKNDRRDG